MADAFVVPFKPRSFAGAMAVGILGRKIPLERSGGTYLSGEFPGGTTTVEGAPVPATVRVLVRKPGTSADGFLVKELQSGQDGTWLLDGLPDRFRYDVLGRKDGYGDVIVSDVTPVPMHEITAEGGLAEATSRQTVEGAIELYGGIPPYSLIYEGAPEGVTLFIDRRTMRADGLVTKAGLYEAKISVSSANGAVIDISTSFDFTLSAPRELQAENIEEGDNVKAVSLAWTLDDEVRTGVNVYRSTGPLTFENLPPPVAELAADATTFVDYGAPANSALNYLAACVRGSQLATSEVVGIETPAPEGPTYRYWRFLMTERTQPSWIAFSEVYLSSGGTDLPATGKVYAESGNAIGGGGVTADMFDGNLSTYRAYNGSMPLWFQIDMGEPVAVDSIGLQSNGAEFSSKAYGPAAFILQGSSDGVVFQDVISESGLAAWGLLERRNFSLID